MKNAWIVRPPQISDVDPLLAIATAVSQSAQPILAIRSQQIDGRFWTITQQTQPIGYAALLPLPGLPHLFELAGGIAPRFQRQGAGSFLWQAVQQAVAGTDIQQITFTTDGLASPASHFLQHHQFELEHEEWTMQLENVATAVFSPSTLSAKLQKVARDTAVRTLPQLYERCFAHTPWFQPYTAAEVSATWEPSDELWTLVSDATPIGFAWLHFPEPTVAEIEPIGIVRQNQGLGYGRFLLTSLLQALQNRGVQTVTLGVWATNETAVHLYQSLGFRHTSSSYSLTHTLPPT
ncbi:MAG: GNAT family N-acetyltransferase [Ardenticatenaceae bacterium]|nr:GNAT family N-acetyltransferase [Ardenticatenaceae bacterium]